MIAAGLATMLLIAQVPPATTALEDQIAPALSAAGLTPETTRFDEGLLAILRQAEFTTPLYVAASRNPWQAPFLFDVFTRDLEAKIGQPNELLTIGTRQVGIGSRRTLIGDPIATAREDAKKEGAFGRELQAIASRNAKRTIHGKVPGVVEQSAALILGAIGEADQYYKPFMSELTGSATPSGAQVETLRRVISEAIKPEATANEFYKLVKLYERTDARYVVAAAHDVALAVQDAAKAVAAVPASEQYDFTVSTRLGLIHFSGGHNDTYFGDQQEPFLTIDTGGDDTYINMPSSTGGNRWVSIVIDTDGNDKYLSDPALATTPVASWPGRKNRRLSPGPAGALLGCSFLFDLKGNDLYRSHLYSIGSGRLGVAILSDASGNDEYDGYEDSVGFGIFGAGIIEDLAGDDRYQGFSQVEGVGQTAGFGALIDQSGDDEYIANNTVIDFASPQSDKNNASMSQGVGNGARRDFLDNHSLAGGIGVLLDIEGDDEYSGAVFAQGVGYWEGIGILRDRSGDDEYRGAWYVQGASAHFAIGFLQDDLGADQYTATMNMGMGGGHDFGTGYLLDMAGDDIYKAPNLSLGAGNANGIGLFLDALGNDSYETSGLTMGQSGEAPAGTVRARAMTFGLFADLAGKDKYPSAFSWAMDNAIELNWTHKGRNPLESQYGVFYDKG